MIELDNRIKLLFNEKLNKIDDSILKVVFNGNIHDYYNLIGTNNDIFTNSAKSLKKLFPKNFNVFKEFYQTRKFNFYETIELFSEMAFIEYVNLEFKSWKFLDEYYIIGKKGYKTIGVSAFLISKYHNNVEEIIDKVNKYPLAINLLTSLLLKSSNQKVLSYLLDCVKNAGLEDSYRFHIFSLFLKDYSLTTLDFFTKAVLANKFTRFKSLKEAFSIDDLGYILKFTSEEYISVLKAIVDNNYSKYIYTKNGALRILAVDAVMKYRRNEFLELCKTWLQSDDTNLKQTVLFLIAKNINRFPGLLILVVKYPFEIKEFAALLQYIYYEFDKLIQTFDKEFVTKLYKVFLALLDKMTKVSYHYNATEEFPISMDITKHILINRMIDMLAYLSNQELIKTLECRYDKLSEIGQSIFIDRLGKISNLDIRKCAVEFLKNDNHSVIQTYDRLKIRLTYNEAIRVSDFLKSKKQSVKNKILKEFIKSSDAKKICEYLLSCQEEYKVSIGIEMQKTVGKINKGAFDKTPDIHDYYMRRENSILEFKKPAVKFAYHYQRKELASIELKRIHFIYQEIMKFVEENKDYEYYSKLHSMNFTIGSRFTSMQNTGDFEDFPLGNKLKDIFLQMSSYELCELYFLYTTYVNHSDVYIRSHGNNKKQMKEFIELTSNHPNITRQYLDQLLHLSLSGIVDEDTKVDYLLQLTLNDIYSEMSYQYDKLNFYDLINSAITCNKSENIMKIFFIYEQYQNKNIHFELDYKIIAKAYEKHLINEDYLKYCLIKDEIGTHNLTRRGENNPDYIFNSNFEYKEFRDFYLKIISNSVNIELERGTLKTPYTNFVKGLNEIYSTEIFIKAIVKIRGLTLVRNSTGYCYSDEKNDIISQILKISKPKETETLEYFEDLLKKYAITKEELIRAVVYNQNFLIFADQHLNISGFKSAVLYFAAHLNESLNQEKVEKIKEYSSIDYHDFKDGAFDFKWYQEMINTISPKEFKLIYDNAKYITVAGLHKRAQRFFEAINNQITIEEAKERVLQTRNKDYCLIYSLIPLKDEKDLMERYTFFGDFLKESKKYGAQRQLSERRVTDIALDNLARNAGYKDTSIFIYEMESKDNRVIQMYEGIFVNGYYLKLDIIYDKVKLVVTKESGEVISKVPSSIAKHESVIEIAEYQKTEEKKRRRLKKSLEEAMENEIEFSYSQLQMITKQPLIRYFFEKLILNNENDTYYFTEGELINLISSEKVYNGTYKISHPVTLKRLGTLRDAMKFVINRQIKQPFKQVFREMYFLSEKEQEANEVLRYKGFNVDIKKAVAALKNRGWGVSEDIGLRKVYYLHNTISTIFREFDYYYIYDFDNENREVETIMFIDRKNEYIMDLKSVNPIIFSETLRDVDLMIAISVNNVFDYELSMSAFEMRKAMIESIIEILNIDNISFLKENIKVNGVYGTYIINIKTGLIFKEGKGNLLLKTIDNYDKPLMLNFIDEDPMTADIITKVLVLSNDDKIKDGYILKEISD